MPTPTVTSHAGTDLLQASGADAMPVTSQPGDEAHRERPQHADEAGAVAPGVMGPASDRHEHQQHREIGGRSRPHRNASLGHRCILPRLTSGADVGDAFGPSERRRDRHRGR